MKYLSTFEAAEKWGVSPRRVGVLCNETRIPGAQRAGCRWSIPEKAEKPKAARLKTANYIKKNREGAWIWSSGIFPARRSSGCRT